MNKRQLLEKIFMLFPKRIVKMIILYGNRRGKDIDLFIVLKDIFVEYGVLRKFPLDIVYMNELFFKRLLKSLDPMATDPILTGMVIYGQNIDGLRKRLKKNKPTKETVKYFLERAKTFLEWTKYYHENNNFKETLTGINFTLTYIYLTRYYQNYPKTTSIADLLKIYQGTMLEKSLLALKKGLFNEITPLIAEAKKLLTITYDMLL